MYWFCFFYFALAACIGSAMYSSKKLEGYPAGHLSNCPGSEKGAVISKQMLRYLTMTVVGPGPAFTAKRNKYNYYQMRDLSKDPNVDFNRRTIIYAGGYMDDPVFPWAGSVAKHYTDIGYNAILLDLNKFTTMHYPLAARFTRPVGKHVAEMLVNLTREGLDPKKVELIGLSLGSQTISFIAKNYKIMTGTKLSRLTGLDPSGPCFRNLGPEDRLDNTDADFVDVVMTNIDGFGMAAPVGHVNFYVNGGEYQPGDLDFLWMSCNTLCSHVRALTLWFSALEHPKSFIALQCDSVQQARDRECYDRKPLVTNVMGIHTNRSRLGVFFLATRNSFPYYLGQKGLRRQNDFVLSSLKTFNEPDLLKLTN